MRKRLKRTKRNPLPDEGKLLSSADKELILHRERSKIKREKIDAHIKTQRKRGNRIDFTAFKKGVVTFRDRKIAKCPECKQNGELHDGQIWGNSVLFIHRGTVKSGKFKMTEQCVVNRRLFTITAR